MFNKRFLSKIQSLNFKRNLVNPTLKAVFSPECWNPATTQPFSVSIVMKVSSSPRYITLSFGFASENLFYCFEYCFQEKEISIHSPCLFRVHGKTFVCQTGVLQCTQNWGNFYPNLFKKICKKFLYKLILHKFLYNVTQKKYKNQYIKSYITI